MKPLFTAHKQHILTGALLAALAINATWKFSSSYSNDFASTTAELEETVVTAEGAYKAKYYVIGNRTTVKLEAMDGGAQCEACNTYDLDGVVLDKSNRKSITEVNIALMKQIEAKKNGSQVKPEPTAQAKSDAKKADAPQDPVLDKCSNDRSDEFTFCAVTAITDLSAKLKDDRNSRSQIDQLYKKHVRRGLLKMMIDIENEERSTEAYDTARQMIEDLYPANAKGVQEDLTNLISKAMTARAEDISDKFALSKSMENSNPQESMYLLNEFMRERALFDNQIRTVGNEVIESFSSHVDDGSLTQSALRMMLLKSYNDPMKRVRDILWSSNPERLVGMMTTDAELGTTGLGRSYSTSRTARSLRDSLGRNGISPSISTTIQRGTMYSPTTTTSRTGRGRF